MSLDKIVANDYGQVVTLTILDVDTSVAADVSSYTTTIQIELKDPDGTIATKTATFVTNGSDGKVKYTLASGDIDAVGGWNIRAKVTSGTAVLSSEWVYFTVSPDD